MGGNVAQGAEILRKLKSEERDSAAKKKLFCRHLHTPELPVAHLSRMSGGLHFKLQASIDGGVESPCQVSSFSLPS